MTLPITIFLMSLALMPSAQTQSPATQQAPRLRIIEELWAAARAGDPARVTAALDKGADVNAKTRYGATALTFAADKGHIEVVKLLHRARRRRQRPGHLLPDARHRHGDDEQPSGGRDAAARARVEGRARRPAAGDPARQRGARGGRARIPRPDAGRTLSRRWPAPRRPTTPRSSRSSRRSSRRCRPSRHSGGRCRSRDAAVVCRQLPQRGGRRGDHRGARTASS